MAAVCLQGSFAIIAIPRDYPLETTGDGPMSDRDRLSQLVSLYRNDVVLLANPEESYVREIREMDGTSPIREKLKALATGGGAGLSADSIAASTAAMVRQDPTNTAVIMASAMDLLEEMPGKASVEDRYLVGRAAIGGLPHDFRQRTELTAFIIGIAARDLKMAAITDLVRRLREYAIGDIPAGERDFKDTVAGGVPSSRDSAYSLALDQALVEAGILSPYAASPEFLVLANNFASEQLAETFFSGDQGTINQGGVMSGGSAGGASGSGSGGQITPPPPPAS